MSTLPIIVVLDPKESLFPECGQIGPGMSVNEFLLVGREEGFGNGIVVADAGAAQ